MRQPLGQALKRGGDGLLANAPVVVAGVDRDGSNHRHLAGVLHAWGIGGSFGGGQGLLSPTIDASAEWPAPKRPNLVN